MEAIDHKAKLKELVNVYGWKILKYRNEEEYTLASPGIDVTLKKHNGQHIYRIFGTTSIMPPIVERMVKDIEAI